MIDRARNEIALSVGDDDELDELHAPLQQAHSRRLSLLIVSTVPYDAGSVPVLVYPQGQKLRQATGHGLTLIADDAKRSSARSTAVRTAVWTTNHYTVAWTLWCLKHALAERPASQTVGASKEKMTMERSILKRPLQATAEWPSLHSPHSTKTTAQWQASLSDGLSDQQAGARLREVGPNTLTAEKREPFWEEFLEELREPMVLLLLVTGVLYALWGEFADAVTVFAIILTLNTIEVVNEQRSKKAIASLRKLAEPMTFVRRAGRYVEIPVEQVVPGDLVRLRMDTVSRPTRAWCRPLASPLMNPHSPGNPSSGKRRRTHRCLPTRPWPSAATWSIPRRWSPAAMGPAWRLHGHAHRDRTHRRAGAAGQGTADPFAACDGRIEQGAGVVGARVQRARSADWHLVRPPRAPAHAPHRLYLALRPSPRNCRSSLPWCSRWALFGCRKNTRSRND